MCIRDSTHTHARTQSNKERDRERDTERATLRLVHHIETEKESREKETMQTDTEIGASDNVNDVMKTTA